MLRESIGSPRETHGELDHYSSDRTGAGFSTILPLPKNFAESTTVTRIHKGVIGLLVTFLVVFPKGGIKAAGVPITWGYLLLGIVSLGLPLAILRGHAARVRRERLLVLVALLPFQLTIWLTLLFYGAQYPGFAVSLLVSFFFIPPVFVLGLGMEMDRMPLDYLFRLIRGGVLTVAAYGIALFFWRILTGDFIEVPYLTVNAADYGTMETEKYNNRGGIFKLISTYNNGNIYGISILLLLPLYAYLEKSPFRAAIVKLSLILTLSRTVWMGLLLYEMVHRLYVRRVSARTVFALFGAVGLVGGGIWYSLTLMSGSTGFLFDRGLGGRLGQFRALESVGALPNAPFIWIAEIVYLSVAEGFGIVGLVAFLIGMGAPLAAHFMGVVPFANTVYKRSLAAALVVYLFVALSDGALLYIPVMAFYWFVVSLLLSDNRSFEGWDSDAPRSSALS